MDTMQPTSEMNIAEILERWPGTAAVFQRLRTACIGCVMAPFCSVADAAVHYELDEASLLFELKATAEASRSPDPEGA
jgi:hybrid cluster-associated redox disulfide protein